MTKYDFGTDCILIVRVSTDVQDYQAQIDQLTAVASAKGLNIVDVVQTKESGFRSIDKKEGFNELAEKLEKYQCHYVLVTELSRLARKKYILETIKQYFIDNKVQLWVQDISFHLFQEDGTVAMTSDITFSVFASIAENEMLEKKARKNRVIKSLNLEGLSIMGKTPIGYNKVQTEDRLLGKKRTKIVIDEPTAVQVRAVFDMYLNGIDGDRTKCSISKINQECIARGYHHYFHSRRNINQCLKYRPFTGEVITSKHRRKNTEYWTLGNHSAPKYVESSSQYRLPSIIAPEIFQAVQDKLRQTSTRNERDSATAIYSDKSRTHETILKKLIVCPKCGGFYSGEYRLRPNGVLSCYYRCKNVSTPHHPFQMSMRNADFAVWAFCKSHYSKFYDYVRNLPGTISESDIQERMANYQKKIQEIEDEIEEKSVRFLRASSHDKTGKVQEAYDLDMAALDSQISQFEERIRQEKERLDEMHRAGVIAKNDAATIEYIQGSKEEMSKYINTVIDKVIALYHDRAFIVLEVVLKRGSCQYLTMDIDDWGIDSFQHKDYIIIDQHDSWKPRIAIASGPFAFDLSSSAFIFNGITRIEIKDTFDTEDDRFTEIPFERFDLYSDEAPKNRVSTMPSVLPDRAAIGLAANAKRWANHEKNH